GGRRRRIWSSACARRTTRDQQSVIPSGARNRLRCSFFPSARESALDKFLHLLCNPERCEGSRQIRNREGWRTLGIMEVDRDPSLVSVRDFTKRLTAEC